MLETVEKISRGFLDWKKELRTLSGTEPEFQKWLFVHVAGVLFGGKAGELLTIPEGQCGLGYERQVKVIEKLSAKWNYSYLPLCRSEESAKVIFYKRKKVSEALTTVPPCILEDKLGYSAGMSPGEFLAEIGRRWKESGRIPHEIGIALGYPAEDVLGYMGLLPLECRGTCGWRIYGNPALSLERCRMFTQARQGAIAFLAA
ncbi:MAG TPA: DUF3793 family protein [Thermodesulfobacteriota bacterium]|nr:DUF3793 family protein [Thermodesulfobacteriota bacterium]